MADLSDVEQAIATRIADILYPQGPTQPSVTGGTIRISRGWPDSKTLQTDLAAGNSEITVFPEWEHAHNTTRYPPVWRQIAAPTVTLTIAVSGRVVTLGGTVAANQNIGIAVGDKGYARTVAATDTLEGLATALAAEIAADWPGTVATGAAIEIAGPLVRADLGGIATMMREIRRQQQRIIVSCWCPDPATRDTLAAATDLSLATMEDADGRLTEFLVLADGSSARLVYHASRTYDRHQQANLYRRDLTYLAEYATTQTQQQPQTVVVATPVGDPAGLQAASFAV